MNTRKTAVCFAILAAALYAINIPFSKLLVMIAATVLMVRDSFENIPQGDENP